MKRGNARRAKGGRKVERHGIMRVAKNAHWISDVIAGAGFGILSTELVYLTHQYKWDNEHIKNFDIFPWSNRKQSGLAVVYTF